MTRRNASLLEFDAIAIEGSLLPAEWLGKVALLEAPQQKPEDYGVPKGLNLRDELGRYWHVARAHWEEVQLARAGAGDAQAATQRFVAGQLREVFGATDLAPIVTPLLIDERQYPVTATARDGRIPLVVAAHNQRLDARDPRFGDAGRQRTAFGLLQDYLNATEHALWGIVSNGLTLRLVRDNASMTRPAWIEVDLERIFTEDRFADFSLLWLVLHASRFGPIGQLPQHCPLEAWREASREQGTRARAQLRGGVEEALLSLGQGFLAEPANDALRQKLATGQLTPPVYFQQLLRLVYRLIFLLTIEERGLLHPPGSAAKAVELYRSGYSLARLRERARRRRAWDRYCDLWQGLKPALIGLAAGQPLLALPALGGLFATDQCPDLDTAELGNAPLLAAVFKLAWLRSDGSLVRINWRDMGPEEFGSVYESLLELVPEVAADGRQFRFAGAEQSRGNARKTSGSYYTPDALVQELLDSALEPVIAQRLAGAADQEASLLSITVCDPACGSGHFLLAAARRLATHLARLRTDGTPSGEDYRHALRDVITHCIFGVDLNPMALELARMALWLEAMTPDKPLGFLDHHLQCGNALLGVLDPVIIDRGLPDAAFAVLSGDNKAVASALRKRNKAERDSWQRALATGDLFRAEQLAREADQVEQIADDNLDGYAAKQRAWAQAAAHARDSGLARLADLFVGAFLLPKRKQHEREIPTSQHLWAVANGEHVPDLAAVEDAARKVCADNRVLHWWVAFPKVAEEGGFVVMLGNPPWDRIKLQEEEFFAARSPLVANAINTAERDRRIDLLRQGRLLHTLDREDSEGLPPSEAEQALHQSFLEARRGAEASSNFAHDSGRYPLTGVGDVNTYALFSETFLQLMAKAGRAGFIVPSGIATDDTTKAYFSYIADGRLVCLYDFRTGPGLFSEIGHQRFKFCLLTLGASGSADFLFFALAASELLEEQRKFQLSPEEFALINPNTRTCPVFRSQRDAELTKKLYRNVPVLIREAQLDAQDTVVVPEANPWGLRLSTMFHMSGDSGLFRTELGKDEATLPLYEAKMIHQFDHRWATYIDAPDKKDGAATVDASDEQKADPGFTVRPRYWVDQREVLTRIARVPRAVGKGWLAVHQAVDPVQRSDAFDALMLALAQWTAGELFRREAGVVAEDDRAFKAQCSSLSPRVERQLTERYPMLAREFQRVNLARTRLFSDFGKWARQDCDTPLDEANLATLAECNHFAGDADIESHVLDILDGWMDGRSPRWLMGWRDICRSTDERTVIASVIPRVGVGHTTPLWYSDTTPQQQAALLGCLNSIALDYLARQKIGGTHLTYGYLKQFPVLSPDDYNDFDLAFIVPRVLELTYTTHYLVPWAADLGYTGAPFAWDPDRRARLRAELDAYYARLYGLSRDDLRYILDPADVLGEDYPSETFRVLKNNELKQYGEYRTRNLVLHEFNRMALAEDAGTAYESLLVPPPGVLQEPVFSPMGVITDRSEAVCAGLVHSLIRLSKPHLSHAQLNEALAWLNLPAGAQSRLLDSSASRLTELLGAFPVSAMIRLAPRMTEIIRSLADENAIRIEQQGSMFRTMLSAPDPTWTIVEPATVELATLLIDALQAVRPAELSEDVDHAARHKEA